MAATQCIQGGGHELDNSLNFNMSIRMEGGRNRDFEGVYTWLLVPDGLQVLHKLLIYWDFHTGTAISRVVSKRENSQ